MLIGGVLTYFALPKNEVVKTEFIEKEVVKIEDRVDTITVKEIVYREIDIKDSDSTLEVFEVDSTISTIEDEILSETLLLKTIVSLNQPVDTNSIDVLLNVDSKSFNENLTIEYWNSPLQLTGYELSRNKLKLFGFDPAQSISLLVDNNKTLIAAIDTIQLRLVKTEKFKVISL